jgi:glucokinase
MILAGDLGGTKSNLGLFDVSKGKLTRVTTKRFASGSYPGAEQIVQEFLRDTGEKNIEGASFGICRGSWTAQRWQNI